MRAMTAMVVASFLSVASAQGAVRDEGDRQFLRDDSSPLTRLARNLPSDVEQRRGIQPNSRNSDDRGRRDWRDDDRGRYRRYDDRSDRRYRSPPPGYRRYSSRPRDWERRGCMQIGPVWFCQ